MWLFPWKLCGFLFMFLTTLLHRLSHFVFHYWPPTSSLWTLEIWFYLLREGSVNKHLLMDHLAHSGRADRLGELLYDFSIIKQPYSDCWLSNSDPWPLLSQSCSFGSVSILWPQHLFYNGFSSFGRFWSCCLSLHWLSFKRESGMLLFMIIFLLIGVLFVII